LSWFLTSKLTMPSATRIPTSPNAVFKCIPPRIARRRLVAIFRLISRAVEAFTKRPQAGRLRHTQALLHSLHAA
jgi:hypothetical protein